MTVDQAIVEVHVIRYIVVRVDDPKSFCTFNDDQIIELFPTAYSALSFIDRMIKKESKHKYEVRELSIRGKVGDSLGGVV